MATAQRYGGHISALSMHYSLVDDHFKEVINETILNNGQASSLLRLLKVWEGGKVDILSVVLDEALIKYEDIVSHISCLGFCFGELNLIITLEDVLYLTGLPIIGKPVVTDDTYLPNGFRELFGAGCDKKLTVGQLFEIINDNNQEMDSRIRALLAAIIDCFITPMSNGHIIDGTYIPFIRNLDEVNSYAWGAALLARLYSGLFKCSRESKMTLDGNGWIALGLLLLHIPRLSSALGIEVKVEPPKLLLASIIEACKPISSDKKSLGGKVRGVFENLVDEDIIWQPYAKVMLMEEMHSQLDYVTLSAPLFCISEVFLSCTISGAEAICREGLVWHAKVLSQNHYKGKKGCNPIIYSKHYKKQLEMWEAGIAKLRDIIEPERERAEASGGASSSQRQHEQPPSVSRSMTALVEFDREHSAGEHAEASGGASSSQRQHEQPPSGSRSMIALVEFDHEQENPPEVRDQQANIPEHELPPQPASEIPRALRRTSRLVKKPARYSGSFEGHQKKKKRK